MRKKIVSLVLCGIMSLGMAVSLSAKEGVILGTMGTEMGPLPEQYGESSMLAAKVATGELAPVEQRLPKEPLVIQPLDSIGRYGGNLLMFQKGVENWQLPANMNQECLLARLRADPSIVVPNLAKDWKLAPDSKSLTLYLREGLKWSDGAPFTVDDILFWYNDILLNEEITLSVPTAYKPGGELYKIVKVNDYTGRFEFSVPWAGSVYAMADPYAYGRQTSAGPDGVYAPAHYLKEFHIKYNPKAGELAKEAGFDAWYQLFNDRRHFTHYVGLPRVTAWVPVVIAQDHVSLARNPYYWKVDTEGNQLPYIDTTKGILAEQVELRVARTLSGQPDVVSSGSVGLDQLGVITMNAEKNNYRIGLTPQDWEFANFVAVYPNHNVSDPFIRELFNKGKFKQALSLAIDREEICVSVYKGVAEPMAASAPKPPITPIYDEKLAKSGIDYDPEKAKLLLDELGLKKDQDGYILRPNGEVLNLILDANFWLEGHSTSAELIADYWTKIGVKTTARLEASFEMMTRAQTGEGHVLIWALNKIEWAQMLIAPTDLQTGVLWAWAWYDWLNSDGEKGEEPPLVFKEYVNDLNAIASEPDEKERIRLGKKAYKTMSDNQWIIGITGSIPVVTVVRASLGNVDIDVNTLGMYGLVQTAYQWYWK